MTRKTASRRTSLLTWERRIVAVVLLVLFGVSFWGISLLAKEEIDWKGSWNDLLHYGRILFLQPRRSEHLPWSELLHSLSISFALSILTTIGGAFAAFFLALGAARNIAPPRVAQVIRIVTALVRSIPTIIWVLVFSVTINIGTDAAVIGMCFHSIAYLVKVFSESFEQINRDTIDALRACGAGFSGIITQALIPAAAPALISWTFFRFEINFINAVAIGAAAGSGGIGYYLFMAGNLYYDIREVGLITYIIFATVIALETLSVRLRKQSNRIGKT